ncbi:MAG: hypothetical protein R3E18_05175 [Sphingomonadaceae bacterium]|nr:hypothetical protein [Sphingomonadaceae bacterium]
MQQWKLARLAGVAAGAVLAGLAVPAGASGDYGCWPSWNLENPELGCSSYAAISPGNDTRINLVYLLREARGAGAGANTYPVLDSWEGSHGRSYFDWGIFKQAFLAAPADSVDDNPYYGSRCVSYPGGTLGFTRAIEGTGAIKGAEARALLDARKAVGATCEGMQAINDAFDPSQADRPGQPQWPEGISSTAGRDYFSYLKASNAFYAENWDAAREAYRALTGSKEGWVAETSRYMLARVALNEAIAPAFDKWGFFEGDDAAAREPAKQALVLLEDYLKSYPDGLYASSATGLKRRALWLAGDKAALAAIYTDMLKSVDLDSYDAVSTIEEADRKLIDYNTDPAGISDPLVVATIDLRLMRTYEWDEEPPELTLEALEAQAPIFRDHPDLYSFLLANHAYYVAKDYRKVMELIPDAARQDSFSPLQFSRQMLRGMALAKRNDRNEGGFWMDVLGGADELYQRPLVELALALNWERNDKVAQAFAEGSPITDPSIRLLLAENSSGPELLRRIAQDKGETQLVRDVALFTLMRKQLAYGQYDAFIRDLPMVPADAPTDGFMDGFLRAESVNTGVFTKGRSSDGYPCPALKQTVQTLARDPRNSSAMLCLGDFYRLNGFDYIGDFAREEGSLGSFQPGFTGKEIPRQSFYQQIIANRSASATDRAYALYRGVWCYGPSGNNSCGGEDVPESTRAAWFNELKKRYPDSKWAKSLKYYW